MTPGAPRTLLATDLAGAGAHDDSWRRLKLGCHSPRPGHWISSAGYALVERAAPPAADAPRVIVTAPGQARTPPLVDGALPCRRAALATPRGKIALDVGPGQARVEIEASEWEVAASPILLAITVCWRFAELERFLDELADWTRSQLQERSGRSTIGRELDRRFRALQMLIVDLPCFEGSLDDPSHGFPSDDAARLYRKLLRRLDLAAWRVRVDERIEILEGSVGALVEEHRHRQQLRWEIALESLILLVILGDVALHLALSFLE